MSGATNKITALYCRLSQEDARLGESLSIENQKAILLEYAKKNHFPNPVFFVDDGYSGTNYDRPGFQSMLVEIEAGRVGIVITKDLSRLGRNSALTGLYTNFTFPQYGVRYIAINDNYDTIDPNSVNNDFAGIKNWFNEFYARDTSRKIRAVQKAKGERGVPLTVNVPYGYVKDPENLKHWLVDPEAAAIVKRIFSMALNYMTRYDLDPSRNNTNETFKLLCCIKTLLHYGIHVDLGTNIDRHNHKEIWNTLDDLKKLQLLQDKNFAWTIGRVDDRLYETNFPDIMMESEILAELQSKPLPDNVHAAFLKTCYNFADKMGLKLNLREHKQTHSYCWSTSSSSNVFYVDMNLKTYRCTCTVGRSRYSLFDFSYENLTNYRPVAVTCNSYAECKDCKIGGFCGGGCQLSHQIDFKKCCTYEEEVFSHFMKTLFIPYIKSKYNEVNQNERKAENRCT